ncbi:MAG: hypothetical protein M3R45_08440 [Pseudomonadota bacterium]|nr:hypothetical protein [Pseudomonadota bacterium]
MSDVVNQIFRFMLKLVLGLFAAIFALSLLVITLLALALSLLKGLITGRKPAPVMLFEGFRQFRSQRMWPDTKPRPVSPTGQGSQIVDVEVREIREEKRLS